MTLVRIVWLFSFIPAVADGQYLTPDHKAAVPPRRIDSWLYGGGDREVIEVTISRITALEGDGPGNWTYEWGTVAAHYEARGERLERELEKAPPYSRHALAQSVQESFLKAQLYYAIGYFPDNRTPVQRASYRKHVETYLRAAKYFTPPMGVIRVPYKDSAITVHLHRPEGVSNPPLVLWTGGVDWWKGSIYHELRDAVSKGLAVAAFDLAGTGEMDQFRATPKSDDVHLAVIDYFSRQGFDRSRMAYVGESFGGYYAVRLAASSAVRAAVNVCGGTASNPVPIEAAAQAVEQRLASPEGGSVLASAHAIGIGPPYDARRIAEAMSGFNLRTQGIVGRGKVIRTPLLNINGTRDAAFPWQGLLSVVDSSQQGEVWLLGTSGHCARDYFNLVGPQLAEWLAERLN
jgi:hypothetical protein